MLAHSPFTMLTVSVTPFATSIASAEVGGGEKSLQFWLVVTVNVAARSGSASSSARPAIANHMRVTLFMRSCTNKRMYGDSPAHSFVGGSHVACLERRP